MYIDSLFVHIETDYYLGKGRTYLEWRNEFISWGGISELATLVVI